MTLRKQGCFRHSAGTDARATKHIKTRNSSVVSQKQGYFRYSAGTDARATKHTKTPTLCQCNGPTPTSLTEDP
jgi:hypothetical protein